LPIGSDKLECWRSILRLSWFGHHCSLDEVAVALWAREPPITGHLLISDIYFFGLMNVDWCEKK
jgi:hypothetical protein